MVTLTIPAYYQSKISERTFSFAITNLDDIKKTTLNITNISYNDNVFSQIFPDFSYFFVDWENNKFNLKNVQLSPEYVLKEYLNKKQKNSI